LCGSAVLRKHPIGVRRQAFACHPEERLVSVIPSGCDRVASPKGRDLGLFLTLVCHSEGEARSRSIPGGEESALEVAQNQKQVPRRSAPSGRQGQVVIPSGCEGSGFKAIRNEKQVPRRSAPSGRQGQVVIPSGCDLGASPEGKNLHLKWPRIKGRSLVAPLTRDDIQRQQQTREFSPRTQSRNRHPEHG